MSRRGRGVPMEVRTAPPERNDIMDEITEPPAMRESECPFCERTVLVCDDPPRCPLCECPLDEDRMRPYTFPGEATSPERPASTEAD
jgi:hypothetical protein